MKIEPFKMERMQSTWENAVDFNLSESGVHPLIFEELVSRDELDEIFKTSLGYIQSDGTSGLKERIASLYPGISLNNILVTSGSSEANFLLMWKTIEPGDEVAFMMPNYMQMWGLLKAFGARVKPFYLKENLNWAPDLDELEKVVTAKTKLIVLTNPNNPTGTLLSNQAREKIIDLAKKADAWIYSDEVYQGAELDGHTTPSFWGTHDKVVVCNGLSKAYGLPGLRVGWMVAPEDFIQNTWPYHDYTTISLSAVSDRLARITLKPDNREKILGRTRSILRTNLPLLESWLEKQGNVFSWVPPKAGAIAYVRYKNDISSTELIDRIRETQSVLLVPGDHFDMENYIRIGFGAEKDYLLKALERVEKALKDLLK